MIRRSLGTKNLRNAKRLRDQILAKRTAAAKFGIEVSEAKPCKSTSLDSHGPRAG